MNDSIDSPSWKSSRAHLRSVMAPADLSKEWSSCEMKATKSTSNSSPVFWVVLLAGDSAILGKTLTRAWLPWASSVLHQTRLRWARWKRLLLTDPNDVLQKEPRATAMFSVVSGAVPSVTTSFVWSSSYSKVLAVSASGRPLAAWTLHKMRQANSTKQLTLF